MRTVAAALRDHITDHPLEYEALRRGVLNRSAFALHIQKDIEEKTAKSVRTGTIVTALTRLEEQLKGTPTLYPEVLISTLSIQSDLMDVSFEKTTALLERLTSLESIAAKHPKALFVRTIGISEVTFVAARIVMEEIISAIPIPPRAVFRDLVAVTVAFDARYLSVPNSIYVLLTSIASRHINIIEIISTYTELTVVINAGDRERCVAALEGHFTTKQ